MVVAFAVTREPVRDAQQLAARQRQLVRSSARLVGNVRELCAENVKLHHCPGRIDVPKLRGERKRQSVHGRVWRCG
ncbi:MAG: hypothetical protein WBP81_35870 [Solirubrobacteraceae bacterium]